jgi:hypothetical protein
MPIFLVVNFAEHFPEGHVPVFTANHFASNVSLLEHSIVRNHNRHYMQALSLGGGHALVRIQDPTNRLVRLSLLAELSTPHSLFILENYCQSTVFDDLFEKLTIDIATLQVLMLLSLAENIASHSEPLFKHLDCGRVFSVSIGERQLNIVVLENISLDEEVSVGLVDGEQDHATAF